MKREGRVITVLNYRSRACRYNIHLTTARNAIAQPVLLHPDVYIVLVMNHRGRLWARSPLCTAQLRQRAKTAKKAAGSAIEKPPWTPGRQRSFLDISRRRHWDCPNTASRRTQAQRRDLSRHFRSRRSTPRKRDVRICASGHVTMLCVPHPAIVGGRGLTQKHVPGRTVAGTACHYAV